jgi:hypothetical protein
VNRSIVLKRPNVGSRCELLGSVGQFVVGIDWVSFCRVVLQLPEDAELIWDDGSPFPEPCLDNVAPMVGKV